MDPGQVEKETIVKEMSSLRQTNCAELDALLDGMLAEVDREFPSWASVPLPFPIPSYRFKLGTMKRMLAALLDGEEEPRRKRSAVLQLAKQLASSKGVWGLEREVRSRTKNQLSMEDMFERTPKDLETPKYEIVEHSDTWEVRNYAQFPVVSAEMESSFGPGTFNALAGYIFGGNKEGIKMAMTTPVINRSLVAPPPSFIIISRPRLELNVRTIAGIASRLIAWTEKPDRHTTFLLNYRGGKKMSFIMPSAFWEDTKACPTPVTTDVQVEANGGGLIADSSTLAVEWFGGYATKDIVDARKRSLVDQVKVTPPPASLSVHPLPPPHICFRSAFSFPRLCFE